MTPPPGQEDQNYAEILALLDPEWHLFDEEFKKDLDWNWPVRQMRMLARMPHEYNTWIWYGHTIPNGDPPQPFTPSTKLCCNLILPNALSPEEFGSVSFGDGKQVRFLTLNPIYRQEMDFKLRFGTEALLDRFDQAGILPMIQQRRPNVCASFWQRLFGS